jgi:hypothetical protein
MFLREFSNFVEFKNAFDIYLNLWFKFKYVEIKLQNKFYFFLGPTWFRLESLCQPALAVFLFWFSYAQPIWYLAHLSLLAHPVLASPQGASPTSRSMNNRIEPSTPIPLFQLRNCRNKTPPSAAVFYSPRPRVSRPIKGVAPRPSSPAPIPSLAPHFRAPNTVQPSTVPPPSYELVASRFSSLSRRLLPAVRFPTYLSPFWGCNGEPLWLKPPVTVISDELCHQRWPKSTVDSCAGVSWPVHKLMHVVYELFNTHEFINPFISAIFAY